MLNIKTLIATVLLSGIAAVSFAQALATLKDAPIVKKAVTKKHVAKKAHKASATKKVDTTAPVAPAAK
ncbi:MAG: hypothetical protein HHJ17_02875 [Rhodoferax sp.]|uniref:hypothetical protein n=1 Tax=Rhodoferax sp. TaxID=50421 RepID=UPI0017B76622|nr:hypothetical protein [Rhodoferax sp.]NMM12474.1 hypothetical protein [Rhodoferax sp.]